MEILINNPLQSLTFALMIFALLSLWIHKNSYLWGTLFGTSYLLGSIAGILQLNSLFAIVLLLGSYLFLTTEDPKGWLRLIPTSIITLISFGFIFHRIPGFTNWLLLREVQVSPNSYPHTIFWNYDKALLGLFPLAFTIPLLKTKASIKKILPKTLLLSAISIVVLLGLSLFFRFISFDPKWPPYFLYWVVANFFFVCVTEEAFFRGFLQKEITEALPHRHSAWFAIFFVSLLFALAHLPFLQDFRYLILVFVASFLYGTTYHLTEAIESSIFAHFLVNLLHILIFTYPTMKP
ncbi:MAG: CPBP family intramembrane glutamic endopeptidase [Candidatus Algichlamydia australiensis]|nr:CPBP family intramembrane glutamic endopeptidase [Chlamydiales bacterium]